MQSLLLGKRENEVAQENIPLIQKSALASSQGVAAERGY
jgi:hypothetical protein